MICIARRMRKYSHLCRIYLVSIVFIFFCGWKQTLFLHQLFRHLNDFILTQEVGWKQPKSASFHRCHFSGRPLLTSLSSGPSVAVEVVGSDAIEMCQQLFRNFSELVFMSGSCDAAEDHLTFFFGDSRAHMPNTATVQPNATCAVILPHAVNAGSSRRSLEINTCNSSRHVESRVDIHLFTRQW